MAFLDKQLMFSEEQDLGSATSGSTTNSTNNVDLGPSKLDCNAAGQPLELLVQVREAFAGSGASVQFQLEAANETAFDTTNVILAETPAIAITSLTVNTEHFRIRIPDSALRYHRLKYLVTAAGLSAGMIDAGIVLDRQRGTRTSQ